MININKKKIYSIIIVIIIIGIMVGILLIANINDYEYELTQLSNHSNRQMMGYIIKTKNDKIVVIDGGTKEDSDNLAKYINKYGGVVNYWFITHVHDDHAEAFTNIINNSNIKIEKIICSPNDVKWYEKYELSRFDFTKEFLKIISENRNLVINPDVNDEFEIDNLKVKILGINNPEILENAGNEQSMVFKIISSKTSLLILGDTGIESSSKLLKNQKEKLKSDMVQMSHHGQAGASQELYEIVDPSICLWPTPEWLWNNDSGQGYNTGTLKTLETRSWMENMKIKNNYIEKDGDITIKIK